MPRKFQMITRKGYDFFEVSSSFQKSIRRGLEDDALYWGEELYSSGYYKYVWKRMIVMATEEVGFADPDLNQRIWSLWQQFQFLKENKAHEVRVVTCFAIMLLTRSKKNRGVDWAKLYMEHCHGRELKPIPDYAKDKHTRRGKMMGRDFEHFLKIASHVEDEVPVPEMDHYKEECVKLWNDTPHGTVYTSMPHNVLPDDHPDCRAFDENNQRIFFNELKIDSNVVLPEKDKRTNKEDQNGTTRQDSLF